VRNLERTITSVVMFKQWAEWEEKYESDGYAPLSEELESSLKRYKQGKECVHMNLNNQQDGT